MNWQPLHLRGNLGKSLSHQRSIGVLQGCVKSVLPHPQKRTQTTTPVLNKLEKQIFKQRAICTNPLLEHLSAGLSQELAVVGPGQKETHACTQIHKQKTHVHKSTHLIPPCA